MSNNSQLTRICSSCGVQKSLSAFLQLESGHQTSYGMICSDCRRTSTEPLKPVATKDVDDNSSSSSDLRIGAKAKISADIEKKRLYQQIKQQHENELKKRDLSKSEKELLTEKKEKAEKEHRKFYLETNKKGFLTDTKKIIPAKQIGLTQKPTAKKSTSTHDAKSHALETKQKEDLIENELQRTTINLTNQFIDPQFAEVRHQSSMFVQFKQWLGAASPLGRANAIKAMENIQKTHSEKTKTKAESKDPLVEFIDKKWGPSSKQGR